MGQGRGRAYNRWSAATFLPGLTYATHTPGMQAGPQTWPSLESSVSSSGTHSQLPPCAATERIKRLGRKYSPPPTHLQALLYVLKDRSRW